MPIRTLASSRAAHGALAMDSRLRGNDGLGRLDLYSSAREVGEFVEAHRLRTLNVACRGSRCPGIHARALRMAHMVS